MAIFISLAILSILVLLLEAFHFKKTGLILARTGLAVTLFASIWSPSPDLYVALFSPLILGLLFLILFFPTINRLDHVALLLFSGLGALVMLSHTDFITLFLGIELLSIPLYVLAGSGHTRRSEEAGIKYFLLGSVASAILLFGMALVFASTGQLNLLDLALHTRIHFPSPLLMTGVLFVLAGMAFKLSAAPFHMWAPDVYEGSSTSYTAYMATVVKCAAIATVFKLFQFAFGPLLSSWGIWVVLIACLSLVVGNLMAMHQHSVKRLIAFSGIANVGFMLLPLAFYTGFSLSVTFFYVLTYSLATLGILLVNDCIKTSTEDDHLHRFHGLARNNIFLFIVLCVSVLSLAGIPPLPGFFAKYSLLMLLFQQGHFGLVALALLATLGGLTYYLRILFASLQIRSHSDPKPTTVTPYFLGLLLLLFALCLMIFPESFLP